MDLEDAIVLHREAPDLRPQGRYGRSFSLNNFASCLSARFNQLGAVADLEEAIGELPALSHFLLPFPFPDLHHAASDGPVTIVNASQYSCDVLVVLLDRGPVHIPLLIHKHWQALETFH